MGLKWIKMVSLPRIRYQSLNYRLNFKIQLLNLGNELARRIEIFFVTL